MRTDQDMLHDVLAELGWERLLAGCRLNARVHNGVATLLGTVERYPQKLLAEQAVRRVAGIRAIADEVEVTGPPEHAMDDGDLAELVDAALRLNPAIPEHRIRLTVDHGGVRLEGTVDHAIQQHAAGHCVHCVPGVKGVVNELEVRAPDVALPAEDVRRLVLLAFQRSEEIDRAQVHVEVQDHLVILTGCVDTLAERDAAEWVALLSPGVTAVDNRLRV
ncbi:MAG: BON domain-containing protein [Gemmatimonadetes bacterium]|nr:BON domain-containing protein [Gemmatimonadota bacterium]